MLSIHRQTGSKAKITDYSNAGYYDITIEGNKIRIRKAGFANDQIIIQAESSNAITLY